MNFLFYSVIVFDRFSFTFRLLNWVYTNAIYIGLPLTFQFVCSGFLAATCKLNQEMLASYLNKQLKHANKCSVIVVLK